MFDVGVLAPSQLVKSTLKQFRAGRIHAPLAIEVGLDYGVSHLHEDQDKLVHSGVHVPYLLHLSRLPVSDQQRLAVEKPLGTTGTAMRSAYVDPMTGARRFTHVGDPSVVTH